MSRRVIIATVVTVAVVVGLVGAVWVGGIVADSSDSEQDETSTDEGDSQPGENEQLSENGTDESENETDEPEIAEIDVNAWDKEVGDELTTGELYLRNETDEVLEQVALSATDGSYTFGELSPGEEYIVSADRTDWPEERVEFTAGETNEVDVVVGYEFQSAESFRYVTYQDFDGDRQDTLEVKGEHAANGNALNYYQRINFDGSDADDFGQYFVAENETLWIMSERGTNTHDNFPWGYAAFPYNDPVSEGVDSYDDWEYIARTEVDGIDGRFIGEWTENKELDRYQVDASEGYSDPPESLYGTVDVYVDPETGYVVRTEADKDVFNENNVHDAEIIFEYKDHGDEMDFGKDDLAIEHPF